VIVFLDDDCEAEPDWLARISTVLSEQPDVGIVAGSLVAPPRPRWRISTCPSASPRDFTLRSSAEDWELPEGSDAVTANLAVRRSAWVDVGPFDEHLGAGATFRGGEDLDFTLRAVRCCVPIRFLPAAKVTHTQGRRFGLRAMLRMITAYGYGQGAVAGKMAKESTPSIAAWNGDAWRKQMWYDGIVDPLRSFRPHRTVRAIPRLIAFERAYRRCRREFDLDEAGQLVRIS
jgi:hypothetical protein